MAYLLAATLLWAFSFGLIKIFLGDLDPLQVAGGRLLLAAAVFAPLLGRYSLGFRTAGMAVLLGSVQFGLMYFFYIASFAYLPAWMVALLTVFTPLYVVLMADLLARRLDWRHLLAAVAAVLGAGYVLARGLPEGADWRGVVLLQLANLCFAAGQVLFPRLQRRVGGNEATLVAWMYQGAALLSLLALASRGWPASDGWSGRSLLVLLYLGLIPTALGFYLWNKGATLTTSGRLAVANNLKIPLAVLVSWLVFNEEADYARVLIGLGVILASLLLTRSRSTGL